MPTTRELATIIATPTRLRLGGRQLDLVEQLPKVLCELRVLEPELVDDPTEDGLRLALRRLQEHDGLPVTGELDDATLAALNTSRCRLITSVSSALVTESDLADLCGSTTPTIRYAFDTGTSDVAGEREFDASRRALRTLSRSGAPVWVEVDDDDPDLTVMIDWTPADCVDDDMRRVVDSAGVLVRDTIAHADFFGTCGSGETVPKPIHFDDEEHAWTDDAAIQWSRFDIESVMLHEASHIVGLQHDGVSRPGVMADSFRTGEMRREFQSDDIVQIRHLYGGTFETHRMRDGAVDAVRQSNRWTSGWSIVETFRIGTQPYVFLLKHSDGDVKIFELGPGGVVGSKTFDSAWTRWWTTAEFFGVGGQTYLFLMKERGWSGSGNNVHVHRVNDGGTIGGRVDDRRWSEGWTSARFFEAGGNTFVLLLKEQGTGNDGNNVHVHRMNDDGTIGEIVDRRKWTEGWTTVETFTVGGEPHLFLMKARGTGSDGKNVHIHRLDRDGTVGARTDQRAWSTGWTTAEFFEQGGDTHLFLLKAAGVGGDGTNVHVHEMNVDGTVGDRTGSSSWDEGFTSVVFFEQDASLYTGALKISRPS